MSDAENLYPLTHFLEHLYQSLTDESRYFLRVLTEHGPIHKEGLRDLANKAYEETIKDGLKDKGPLITSRHMLDIHTARLEGAGLVKIRAVGRVRLYELSALGEELLEYTNTKIESGDNK